MKKLTILLLALILVSCERKVNEKENIEVPNETTIPSHYNFYIKKIDGCDYIILQGSYAPSIIHKQNCKNHTDKQPVIQK